MTVEASSPIKKEVRSYIFWAGSSSTGGTVSTYRDDSSIFDISNSRPTS